MTDEEERVRKPKDRRIGQQGHSGPLPQSRLRLI